VNRRRRSVRQWRRRGRRGQVSAVATILGLLLVVTFIANYLTTTLPQQMSVNDLNHVVQVEDQVGRLSALLEAATTAGAVGAQFTQPITLGSAGQPPFASADPGTLSPSTNGSLFNLSLPIGGAWTYEAPTVGTVGYSNPGGGCTKTGTSTPSITCTGTSYVFYNASSAGTNYALSVASGVYDVNIADSGSNASKPSITTTFTGTGTLNLLVIGSNISVPLTFNNNDDGTANIEIVGNYDNLTITDNSGGATINLLEVGLHDATWLPRASGTVLLANVAGTTDYVRFTGTTTYLNANTVGSVYFLGDSPTTTACPNDNLAASDFVEGGHIPTTTGFHHVTTYYGDYNVTYNVTTVPVTLATAPNYAIWTSTNNTLTPSAAYCPLYAQAASPIYFGGTGSGFGVHLANTYLPQADIALDQGGVVYAQEGGVPIMLDPPAFTPTFSGNTLTSLSIWFPIFVGHLPVDYGLSTAEVAARLLSVNAIDLVANAPTDPAANAIINVTVATPFAAAWIGFFNSTSPWDAYTFGCVGPTAACDGPYSTGGPIGTVYLDIPTGTGLKSVDVDIATFAVSLV